MPADDQQRSDRAPQRLVEWRWFWHVSLFTLALVLRVGWVVWVDRDRFPFDDTFQYHGTARNLVEGRGFKPPTSEGPSARWPPGYSAILAGLYRVFGVDPIWGELFNALVGAATVVLLMVLVARVVDRRTSIVAGAMLAVLPGPILWTDVLLTETVFTAVFVAFYLLVVTARPTWGWVVAIGVVVGIGALIRGEALVWGLLPIVAFWRTVPLRRFAAGVVVMAIVVMAVMSPWVIRNAVQMEAFVPLSTNSSATLWAGHNPAATGGQTYPSVEYYEQFDQTLPAFEIESSKALRNDAIDYALHHPLRELELIPLKLLQLNRGDSFALDWVNDPRGGSPISAARAERIGVVADASYYALLTLTVLGGFYLGRRFWRARIGVMIVTSFATALVLYGFVYYGNYRYRLPYEPLMVVVAAAFLTTMWQRRSAADETVSPINTP